MTLPEGPSLVGCAWSRQAATFFPYGKLLTDCMGQELGPDSVGAAVRSTGPGRHWAGWTAGTQCEAGSLTGLVDAGCQLGPCALRVARLARGLQCGEPGGCVPGENPGGLGGS